MRYLLFLISLAAFAQLGASPGSLYSASGRLADAARDVRASEVNDIITIVVNEAASAVVSGTSNSSRKSSVAASITGAAGAQLIGLVFVAVTLGVGLSAPRAAEGIRAFVTPTLVNFGSVLFQAVLMLAPWPSIQPLGWVLIASALVGLAQRVRAMLLKRKLDFVDLSRLDWIAYNGAPLLANLALVVGGAGIVLNNTLAPFAIAGASALLLFAGIYGAWDITLWIMRNRAKT